MPSVLDQPRLLNPSVSSLPARAGASLLAVIGILNAPADQPNLPVVVKNVCDCLRAMQARLPQALEPLTSLTCDLAEAALALSGSTELFQPAGMIGRVSAHRPWALFASNLDQVPISMKEILGIEFARAYLTHQDFSARIATDMHRLVEKNVNCEPAQEECDKLENQMLSQLHRVGYVFSDRIKGLDAVTTAFNAQVVATLTAQSNSMRLEESRAAGGLHELSAPEFADISKSLRLKIEAGDARSLQVVLAYCLGLPWDLSRRVPFFGGTTCPSIVWIRPADQCIYFNLERVFPALSKQNTERHVKTSLILVIPLPEFAGYALFAACAANPGLEDVGSLAEDSQTFNRSLVPGADANAAIRPSIARFIASRAGVALRAGVTKDAACYVTVSLHQINNSDHHYLTKDRSSIWTACQMIYDSVGWGPCVPDPNKGGLAFGSRVTPEADWVKELIEEHSKDSTELRPGKRYRLESLVKHHNAYVKYVALLLTILIGGRNREVVSFDAHTWRENGAFVQHGDKLVGPLLGLTPLPLSARCSAQIGFWRVHLKALDHRLEKLNFQADHPVRALIRSILACDSVNMIFTLNGDVAPDKLYTKTLFQGAGKLMNRDFSRHFMPNPMMEEGLPFEFVQSWLRHYFESNSPLSINSSTVQSISLSAIAQALDRIALNLGLHPIHGISRSA